MYTVIKRMEISASHSLRLSYPSKCENLHGHNWMITVYCRSKELNADGMVVDFSHIKRSVKSLLDHQNLNDILPFNPTAENMATYLAETVAPKQLEGTGVRVVRCTVEETRKCQAEWKLFPVG